MSNYKETLLDIKRNNKGVIINLYTCIWFSGPGHRKRCMLPNWTRSSKRRRAGSCDWCRGAVHQSSCSCCSPPDASCQLPKSVPVSPHSHTATAAHTHRPAAVGLETHIQSLKCVICSWTDSFLVWGHSVRFLHVPHVFDLSLQFCNSGEVTLENV